MENEVPQKQENPEEAPKPLMHTYADDLANALDTTDAKVVQELLSEGKEREQLLNEKTKKEHQKGWYKLGAIILILFTLAAVAYSALYYRRLTVPAEKAVSVGVFPSTEPILFTSTDIRKTIDSIKANTSLQTNKPTLVPIVSDEKTLILLTNSELFSFFEARPSEPFLASFSLIRLGVMNDGKENIPFVIGSITDPEISSKELLIAEPQLLQMLYKALNIDISLHQQEIGKEFSGEYMFNIPVRTLRYNTVEQKGQLLFMYGKVNDKIVVFTTKPSVLKAIYDSIISQHN